MFFTLQIGQSDQTTKISEEVHEKKQMLRRIYNAKDKLRIDRVRF